MRWHGPAYCMTSTLSQTVLTYSLYAICFSGVRSCLSYTQASPYSVTVIPVVLICGRKCNRFKVNVVQKCSVRSGLVGFAMFNFYFLYSSSENWANASHPVSVQNSHCLIVYETQWEFWMGPNVEVLRWTGRKPVCQCSTCRQGCPSPWWNPWQNRRCVKTFLLDGAETSCVCTRNILLSHSVKAEVCSCNGVVSLWKVVC